MAQGGGKDGIKKTAAFLGGFILPFPLYIVVNFSSFAVERFHLPPNKIPLFINKFFSSMEVSCLVGMIITCAAVVVLGDSSNILSIANIWTFFITVVILFISYIYGGDFGRITHYYWMVNMLGFVLGINYISNAKVSSGEGLFVILGRSLSGILVVIYQMGFYYIGSYYGLEDLGHRMFVWFFIMLIFISLSASMTWTVAYKNTEDENKCCCCCKECKGKGEAECKCDEGDCKLCKIAKILCCLCKNGEKCTKCVEKFSNCLQQLTSGECSSVEVESLKCTCKGCDKENTCCRVKRFLKFCEKSCDIIKNAICYCTTIIRLAVAFKTRSSNTSICVGTRSRAVIELCACCGECENNCLKSGKCSIVNILKCLFADEKCLCQNQVRENGCNSLCKCVLDLFKKIKCTLNISPCVKCSPCTATDQCTKGQCCLVCWKRLFKCYIICGGKCKPKEDKCKCCCVGGESSEEPCTCCTPQSPVATECTCAEGEKCCGCCISCGETCKKTCECKSGGECNDCCCCCKKNCQSPKTQSSSKCIFAWIYYEIIILKSKIVQIIFEYYEAFYCYCTGKSPHSSCKCCCCKNGKCACPIHKGQAQEQDCKCCCCSGGGGEGDIGELSDPNAISALLMFPISNPIAYSFNPSIAPYQFLGLVDGYKVSLLVTFTTCIPSCVFTAINETPSTNKKGPKNKWDKDGMQYYNMTWLAMIPLLTAALICLIMLHYPYCRISRYFYGSKFKIYLLCIALQLSNEVMLGIGMGGVGSQGSGNNGTLTAFSLLLAFLTLVIGMFISDGYLKTYRKADRDHWPTKGYTRYRGFKFWFGSGVREAKRTFREVFTRDMRKLLISYE